MKKIVAYLIFVLALIDISYALTANIDIKPSFKVDDEIYFDYTIIPSTEHDIVYTLQVSCPNAPKGLLEQKRISPEADKEYKETYKSFKIDSSIEPQTCKASVIIIEPYTQLFSEEFSIITNPSFSFDINLYKEALCTQKSKTVVLNEDIYLDYDSEVDEPEVKTTLTFPDKTTQEIILPTPIKTSQIGTYTIDVTASKEGYKTLTKKEQFAVIEKQAEILFVSKCNSDGICDNEENSKNCPQDCISGRDDESKEIKEDIRGGFSRVNRFIILSIVMLAFIVGMVICFEILREKSKKGLTKERLRKKTANLKELYTKKKGYTEKQVESKLVKGGWDNELIYKMFMRI